MSWSIYEVIEKLLDTTELVEPTEVAEKLLADLDVEHRALAFEQVAPRAVYEVMRQIARGKGRSPAAATSGTPTRTKADQIREAWRADLRNRFRGEEGWRLLGEFTIDDHIFAANYRRWQTHALIANAVWHEEAAAAMRKAAVRRFDQLPEALLADMLRRRKPEASE